MNIYLRELKASLKSLLIWCGVMALLILIAVSKFSAFAGDPEMLKILDTMPPALLEAMSLRAFNLTTVTGFYGVMFIYFGLMGAIAAAMWASDSITKEERDKTVEFSLVLPVSRSRVVTAKLMAALTNCVLFVAFTWGVSVAAVQSYQPDAAYYRFLSLEMAAMFAISLIFLAVGLLLGCAMQRYKVAGSTAVGIILAAYMLSIFSGMQEDLAFLKWISPFKYFDAGEIYRSDQLDPQFLALSAGIVLVCLVSAYLAYNRRDLYI